MADRSSSPVGPIVGVALALAVVGAAVVYVLVSWQRAGTQTLPPARPVTSATPALSEAPLAPAGDAVPPLDLPPLDESDAFLAKLVAGISSRPELLGMLLTEDHARRFVAVADNIAQGGSPRAHLPSLAPRDRYVADAAGDGFVTTDATFTRYDLVAELFCSIDPKGAAILYQQTKPLLAQAYKDLGYPAGNVDDAVSRAIRHLVAAPVPFEPIRLGSRGSTFVYADPALESLTPAQKHMLRMGPGSQRRVQQHLRAISSALGMVAP